MWTYSNSRYSIIIVEKGIVEKGIQLVQEFNTVIVGDDTNLLVMMLDRFKDTMTSHDLYMFRPSSDTLLNIGQLLGVVPEKVLKCLLLVHCASGCDTVSSISGIGKTRLVKQIEKTEYPLSMTLYQRLLDFANPKAPLSRIFSCIWVMRARMTTPKAAYIRNVWPSAWYFLHRQLQL